MNKFELILWTDEMVFTRGALIEQLERYSKGWRRTFIESGRSIAEVYIPAIRACQRVIEQIDEKMPQIEERA